MKTVNKLYWNNRQDKIFLAFVVFALCLLTLSIIYPLIYMISASLSSVNAVQENKVFLWPVEPTLLGYRMIFVNNRVLSGYANTLFYTVCGTAVKVFMTILIAYPLSRKDFNGRGIVMLVMTITLYFSGGLIPTFILIRNLGLYNTRAIIVILGAVSVYQVIITRTYFAQNIPEELNEAAGLDGCNIFRFIPAIVLPLSKPIIAVLTLMFAVGHWNSYFTEMIYLQDINKYPLQMILREILIANTFDPLSVVDVTRDIEKQGLRLLLRYSLIVVASIPVLMIYPFIQKYFVKGVMIGSLKG